MTSTPIAPPLIAPSLAGQDHPYLQTTAVICLIALLALGGCSWMPFFGDDEDEIDEEIKTTEHLLYRNTQQSLRIGNYDQAIQGLEQLEARFPFGRYADQAQLELIFARYMSFDHEDARTAADRFIRLHPQHSNIDYAFYLKGLAAYNKNQGLMDRLFSSNMSKRDVSSAREAYADFADLLEQHPDSQYVPDAKQRMIYLRNVLADSELHVADYYMRRGAYLAASNRARYVVENYSKSMAVPDALAIMIEANWKLGLPDAANDTLRVLAVNYPNYSAFDGDGNLVLDKTVRNRDRSWMNVMTLGILDRPEVPPPLKIQHPEGFVPPEPRP
ncbi:MAG: outer membrane protein assembly factor BamD, partial [Gammaproteobacteria bacterium]|nr:outer membrane protein assembly factor BamD [Gammaproteobacteria bacterium]